MSTPQERADDARQEAREIAGSDCIRCWTGEPHDHDDYDDGDDE